MQISGLRPMAGAQPVHLPVSQLPGFCSKSILCFESVSQLPRAPFTSFPILPDEFKCPIKEEIALTSGEWEVLARHGSKVPESPHTPVHIHVHRHTHMVLTPPDPGRLWLLLHPHAPHLATRSCSATKGHGGCTCHQQEILGLEAGLSAFPWILVGGTWPILPAIRSVHLASFRCMKLPVDTGGAHRGTALHPSLGARSAKFSVLQRDPLIRRPGALPPSQLL